MEYVVDLECLKKIDEDRRETQVKIDKFREKRNKVSKEIGNKKSKGEDDSDLRLKIQGVSSEIKKLEVKLNSDILIGS